MVAVGEIFGVVRSRHGGQPARVRAPSLSPGVAAPLASALCFWSGPPPPVAPLAAGPAGGGPTSVLTRRWTWRTGGQMLPYTMIVIGSAVTAAIVTSVTSHLV